MQSFHLAACSVEFVTREIVFGSIRGGSPERSMTRKYNETAHHRN